VSQASTSSRGVSAKSINVVFPVISLSSVTGLLDIAEDKEYGDQIKAIHLYVNQINQAGGIHGRDINPIIVPFDPTDNTTMRALCQQWTQGTPPVFAVLDGVGTWTGDNELCVTQEGHTPMIAAWTTVTNWTNLGSPYLWWTGADAAPILDATVKWGLSSGRLGHGKKVGVVVSDQAADQTALNSYLLPALKKNGITPQVFTIPADINESASTSSGATLAVERMKAAGVQSVIPLLPGNAFEAYLAAETTQQFYPTLLLSDYQSTIEFALGLIPSPYESALNGQEGVTAETLGGVDDARPESSGGYDPGVRSCFETWHKAYPAIPKGEKSFYIEEQGPIQGWCSAIRLFADAANKAGPDLNRRTFVTAMSTITNFQGGLSPVWSFSPTKHYGPTTYQIVKIRNNVPPSKQCDLTSTGVPQGTCWVSETPFMPLPNS
jgi:ABC-type branched-subunit amino acid transport system substrate-binding protein